MFFVIPVFGRALSCSVVLHGNVFVNFIGPALAHSAYTRAISDSLPLFASPLPSVRYICCILVISSLQTACACISPVLTITVYCPAVFVSNCWFLPISCVSVSVAIVALLSPHFSTLSLSAVHRSFPSTPHTTRSRCMSTKLHYSYARTHCFPFVYQHGLNVKYWQKMYFHRSCNHFYDDVQSIFLQSGIMHQ